MVWCLWLEAREGAEGEKHFALVGLWAWQMDSLPEQSADSHVAHVFPEHHPRAQRGEEGLMALLSDSEAQSSAEVCLFHDWKPLLKCISAPPGTLNLKKITVFGMSVTLFEKLTSTRCECEQPTHPAPCPLTSTALPFQEHWFHFCKGIWQFIKHKDGDTLRQLLSHPASSVSKSSKTTLQIQCLVCGWSQSHQSLTGPFRAKSDDGFGKAELDSHTELVCFTPITGKKKSE